MFQFQKNSGQYLYHYTKIETAIEFIIKDKALRFSRFDSTNDPKESKDWLFSLGTNQNRDLSGYNHEKLSKLISDRIKTTTQLLCFSRDKELTGNHMVDISKRGFCKPRMWAQYGGNHTGVCLIFDFKMLSQEISDNFSNTTWLAANVIYKDRLLAEIQVDPAYTIGVDEIEKWGEEEYAFSHSQQYAKRLFFEKGSDWKNEDEYRWVLFDRSEQIYFNYRNSLKGIMFGEYCSRNDISEVVNLTRNEGIKFQKLKWRNCAPWYDFGQIEWV